MAVPFSNTKLRVPKGFQSLLEGFAREVLRHQPTNIYEFGAQYFDRVLKEREAGGDDPAKAGAELEDRFYNNHSYQDPKQNVNDPQMDESAVKIQAAFRGHVDRKRVHDIKEEKEAAERSVAAAQAEEEQAQAQAQAAEEEIDIDLTDPDVEKAAVKIQSSFRGFKTRREVVKSDDAAAAAATKPATPPPVDEEAQADAQADAALTEDDAALAIQSSFRGFKTRKDLKSDAEPTEESQVEDSPAEPAAEVAAEVTEEPQQAAAEQAESAEEPQVDRDQEDAALSIQSGFRGYQARKRVKGLQQEADNQG